MCKLYAYKNIRNALFDKLAFYRLRFNFPSLQIQTGLNKGAFIQ